MRYRDFPCIKHPCAYLGSSFTTQRVQYKSPVLKSQLFFFYVLVTLQNSTFVSASFTDDPLAAHWQNWTFGKVYFFHGLPTWWKVDFAKKRFFVLQTKNAIRKRGLFRLNQNWDFSKTQVFMMTTKPKSYQKTWVLNLNSSVPVKTLALSTEHFAGVAWGRCWCGPRVAFL